MPKSRNPTPTPTDSRRFTPEEAQAAKARLGRRISELKALDQVSGPAFVRAADIALDTARNTVSDEFGPNSNESRSFWATQVQIGSDVAVGMFEDHDREAGDYDTATRRVQDASARLETLLATVDEKTRLDATPGSSSAEKPPLSRRIFVVHGHDEGAKQSVARLLESLDLEPIILHEQVDKGRTVIEKFEDYADVGFAVILMTADDRGGRRDASTDDYQLRARQNVVLEMGFFLGRLGRGGVCMLYGPQIEMPSDYAGVLGKKFDDAGTWKLELAREIDAAKIEVDFNRLKKK